MSAPVFDLQSHSLLSDGALAPAEVVARAAAAGVEVLSLTDHDAVGGVAEALAAGAEHGIRVVSGVELSSLDGEHEDLHVCGYAFDHESPGLLDALEEFRADRNARGGRMADALRENGWAVLDEELDARSAAGAPIGRPHLAAAVFAHPDNAARIAEAGFTTATDVLVAELIPGKPSYRRRTMPTVAEAITVIHDAGGLASWAHPYWDLDTDEEVRGAIARFAAAGVDGVEAFYTTHTEAQTRVAYAACVEHDLLTTGSADFHGPDHPRFNRFRAFETYDLAPRLMSLSP